MVSCTHVLGHVVRLDRHEASWTLPRMGLSRCEPQRKFGNWLRTCDPGDRSRNIFVSGRFTYGRAILCWERRCKVSATCDQLSSMEADRGGLRGLLSPFPFTW